MMAADKLGHLVAGFLVALAVLLLTGSAAAGLALACVAGIVKELRDAPRPDRHTLDVWDALATVAGGLLVFAAAAAWGAR